MTALAKKARAAGGLYIVASVVGFVRLGYVPKVLFVQGNAAATIKNIAAHESFFRVGIVCYVLGALIWLFVPLALYRLLSGVDKTLAVLMVILGTLMQVPIFCINTVNDVAALLLARGGDFLSAIDPPRREAFAMLFLDLHHQLDIVNGIFWGVWLFPFGLLVYRSRFLPRWLGVWLVIAGFGWLAWSVTALLSPQFESAAYRIIQPVVMGEILTMLWLAIVGAREQRMAAAA